MLVLIWMALLLFPAATEEGKKVNKVTGEGKNVSKDANKQCDKDFTVTLSEVKITAEAGLCVVIPCSFNTTRKPESSHFVWHKCNNTRKNCRSRTAIFRSETNDGVVSEFKGRMSMLEPDLKKRNCSIIITDLNISDSDSYKFEVAAPVGCKDSKPVRLSVQALSQKPIVMVPPLIEGQETSLTCTAPGLCPGPGPKITWTWRGPGHEDSHIPGNITDFKTENLTDIAQRHGSTLTFNPRAEHHGTEVTCKVSFNNGITTEETVTLNITSLSQKPIVMVPPLIEGQETSLTCTAPGLCPGPGPKITWTWRGPGHEDSHISGNITDFKTENLTDVAQRYSSTLTFNPMAQHHGTEVTCKVSFNNSITTEETVTLNVTSGEEVKIMNMTCSIKLGSNDELHVPQVVKEYSGKYVCKVGRANKTEEVNITVMSLLMNSNSSACAVQPGVMTCDCVSEAFGLLTTTQSEYSVTFNMSKHTIGITVSAKNESNNSSVECVSSSDEAKQNHERRSDFILDNLLAFLTPFIKPHAIIAFVIGILSSAAIFCLVSKCCRNKRDSSGNMANGLEMISTQGLPLVDAVVENDGFTEQAEGAAMFDGQAAADCEIRDVEYSDIDFFLLKRENPTGAKEQETQETEYAEINKKDKDGGGGGVGGGEQEEVVVGEEEEGIVGEEEEVMMMVGEEEEVIIGEEEELL